MTIDPANAVVQPRTGGWTSCSALQMIVIHRSPPRGDRNGAGRGRMRTDSRFRRGEMEEGGGGRRGWIVDS